MPVTRQAQSRPSTIYSQSLSVFWDLITPVPSPLVATWRFGKPSWVMCCAPVVHMRTYWLTDCGCLVLTIRTPLLPVAISLRHKGKQGMSLVQFPLTSSCLLIG